MSVETVEKFLKRGGVIEICQSPKRGMKRKKKKSNFNSFGDLKNKKTKGEK